MRIFINDSGDLCFSFRRHYWEDETVIILTEDHTTRRRINRVFRMTTSKRTLQKALWRLRALEHEGHYLPGGYEYAMILDNYVDEVVNSRF